MASFFNDIPPSNNKDDTNAGTPFPRMQHHTQHCLSDTICDTTGDDALLLRSSRVKKNIARS